MTDVLISYARRDRDVAARLAAQLAERGLNSVWDIADLPEGELLRTARMRSDAAPVVIALWSVSSASTIWVTEEAAAAAKRNALVSASIDGTPAPGTQPTIDLAKWNADGDEQQLDPLIKAIADAASRSVIRAEIIQPERAETKQDSQSAQTLPAVAPAPGLPLVTPQNGEPVNPGAPPGEAAAAATLILIAFLTLLGVAVARKEARTPATLPPISMDATEPLDVTIIPPTPEEENAPSGLRPIPSSPQDSTGSVRK